MFQIALDPVFVQSRDIDVVGDAEGIGAAVEMEVERVEERLFGCCDPDGALLFDPEFHQRGIQRPAMHREIPGDVLPGSAGPHAPDLLGGRSPYQGVAAQDGNCRDGAIRVQASGEHPRIERPSHVGAATDLAQHAVLDKSCQAGGEHLGSAVGPEGLEVGSKEDSMLGRKQRLELQIVGE